MTTATRTGWLSLVDRVTGRGPAPIELWAQFRRNSPLYAVGTITLAGQQWCMAQRDYLVRDAVDAIGASASQLAAQSALLILAVSLGAMLMRLCSRVTMFTGGRNVEYEMRRELLAHLHRLGPSFFGQLPTGEIMSRATNDLGQVRLLLGFGVLNVVSSAFGIVSALYVMVDISWRLSLAALAVFPLLIGIMRWFSAALFRRNRDNQESIGRMSDRVLASLSGVRVVRSFAMEDAEVAAFEETNRDYLEKGLALARLRGSMGPVMGGMSAVGVLVVFWYGGVLLVEDPGFSEGDFVAFWLALLRLVWPMMALGFVAAVVQRGRAGYERLRRVFDAEPDIQDGDARAPRSVRGSLRVEGLSFAYGDDPVLDDVSFEVPAGSSLAIVGRTGAGKSTLAALLPRLLPTPEGTVFLDGRDVCDLPLDTVRGTVGYAQQDAFLFSTTVSENVAYAVEQPGRELVESAAREAQVLEDVLTLPDGFDTVVGERGVQLSGGQKQRVALARALIREPPVLVLDDPLSAVDAHTEAAILEALERQKAQRTVVLITHRVAAAQRCDQIVVLERGRVVERGRHDALLARDGLYALFAAEQQMEADLAAIGIREAPAASLEPAGTSPAGESAAEERSFGGRGGDA
ncbi:MAG: ABC transporter ATP-binding protein [Myxococcota bacterium]